MVADVQALTDNADNPQKIRNNVVEVVLDNLACGVDPKKTTFFIQSQAADILFCKANTVPVGIDQMPVLEQANEIIKKFNATYGVDLFSKITGVVSNISRLVGIDGNSKMSKSLGNCIYLSDSDKEIEEKVMQAYTDPHHIHVEDKGKVEGNVVFTYLDVFDEDKKSVAELKAQYQKGGLGDVVLKQ